MIRNEIRNIFGNVEHVLIADSTGVTTDRAYAKTMIKCKKKKRKIVEKMNILAEYYPSKKAIVIADGDAFFSSDAYSAAKMLDEIDSEAGILFADAGFDYEGLFEKCFKQQIKPIIKQKNMIKSPESIERKLWKCLMRNYIENSEE